MDIFAELGSEWDWHVAQYKKEQDRIYTKQHAIKKFSRTFQGEEDVPSFPLAITITGLTLLDLKSMHRLKNNRPYVELSCGTTQERTSVMENVLDSCTWQDVRWRVTLVSENANLIFLVFSEKLPMGRFILSGDELMRLHRNKHSCTEVMGDVKLDEEFTGKISFRCKLHASTDASTLLSSASYTEGSIALDDPSVTADYSQDVKLPAVVTLHSVELAELPAVSSLKANSPQVVLTCGHFSSTTVPKMNSGSAAAWDSMGVSFPVQDKLHIEWKVFSGFVELGTMVLRAAELVKIARDGRSGAQVITRDLHNGKDVCGKVRVVLTYSLEGRNYTVGKQLAKLQQLAYKEPTIAGYGALPLSESVSSINETTEVVVDRYSSVAGSVLLQDSKAVDPSLFPLRLTVTDILGKSPHTLYPCSVVPHGSNHYCFCVCSERPALRPPAGQELPQCARGVRHRIRHHQRGSPRRQLCYLEWAHHGGVPARGRQCARQCLLQDCVHRLPHPGMRSDFGLHSRLGWQSRSLRDDLRRGGKDVREA